MPPPDQEVVAERLARLAEQPAKVAEPESPVEVELPPENVTAAPSEVPADESEAPAPIVSADAARRPRPMEPAMEEIPSEEALPSRPREPRGIYVPGARPIEDTAEPAEPAPLPETEPQLIPPVKASGEGEDDSPVPDFELMQDLQSETPAVRNAAELKLNRRGYKASHLSLARKLTSPDAAVRRKLAESLPQAAGIDPRPWLLRLAEDPDERVRSAALSILRTSQDPELLQRVR